MKLEFLDTLEAHVQQAADRISELGEKNAELAARVTALERELASSRGSGDAAWTRERDQVRRRVEKLAARLQALLEA
jgi:FtsZ-binding cell division protein ZapB